MNKSIKSLLLLATLLVLVVGISSASAADMDNSTSVSADTSIASDSSDVVSTSNDNAAADKVSSKAISNSKDNTAIDKASTSDKASTNEVTKKEAATEKQAVANKTLKQTDEVNYYVSESTGSDDNDGSSQSTAFKTIGKAVNLTTSTGVYNIYIGEGTYKGAGNTNLTINGSNTINFIGAGINKTVFDGEAKFDIQMSGYTWGSSDIWKYYVNYTGNWFMNITQGEGQITLTNFTMMHGWVSGGSSIAAYKNAPVENYGKLTINNMYFYQNYAGVGTVRNRETGTLYVNNSVFDRNQKAETTGNFGAGVYNNGTAVIENSVFENNYARWGTITNDRIITINNCTLRNNHGYDGSSTYKYGSGIATNTGAADFYNAYGAYGLKTTVTNSTFINNDQTDIYQLQGDLSAVGNSFINSTGIYIYGTKLNLSVSQNITNNTFSNVVGSALTVSLSSTSKPAIAIRSVATGYNLTISDNVIDAPDTTYGKAMQIKANALILNNTANNVIELQGTNITVADNTVNSVSDYGITETSAAKNNIIENNTVYAAVLTGDNAIKASSTTTVEGNLPTSYTYIVTEDNYSTYFNDDGTVKSDVVQNGTKVLFSGNLTNKNIVFDNVKLYVGVNNTATLCNSTITTTNNAKVTIEGLKINNTANTKNYVVLFNSTGNKLSSSTIYANTTEKIHGVILADDGNTVTGSYVYVYGPSNNILYDKNFYGIADTIGILVTSNNNLLNNTRVYVASTLDNGTYGSVDGIDIKPKSGDTTAKANNKINNVYITVTGDVYAYGLNLEAVENTYVYGVRPTVTSDFYASGVQLNGKSNNNSIAGYVTATAPTMAYGAYITGLWSGGVNNTDLTNLYLQKVNASYAYGLSLEGITNTKVNLGGTDYVYGDYVTGILLNQTANTNIDKLTLNVTSTTANSSLITIAGATNTTINGTTLKSNNGKGIVLTNTTNDNITQNYINVNNILCGDEAVEQTNTTNAIVANNTPKQIVVSDDTYDMYFDENSTLNVTAAIITIGDKLTNKVLNINTNLTIYNPYNTTMYNTTIAFVGNNTGNAYMYGLKFDNVDKTAVYINYSTTGYMQKNIYFKDGSIIINGDNITAIEKVGTKTIYLSIDNTTAILNSDSSATFVKYYSTSSLPQISNSNITVNAKDVSKVLQADSNTGIYFYNNNIYQTGDVVVTINGTNYIQTGSSGFNNNNITASGNDVTIINTTTTSTYGNSLIQNSNFNVTSTNPIKAINMNTGGYVQVKNNAFIINAYNGNTPVIYINSSSTSTSVNNNYIQALDVVGNDAATVTTGTVSNNKPTAPMTTTITIENVDSIKVNETTKINITLRNENNITLAYQTINLRIGNDITTVTTDANGQAQYEYKSENVAAKPITATYNGNAIYSESQATSSITISKLDTTIVLDDVTATYGDKITLTATLKDENGNPINGGKVAFKLNGKTLKDANGNVIYAQVVNGVATITVDGTYSAKTYTISVVYSGSEVYSSQRANSTLTIVKANPTMTITPSTYTPTQGNAMTVTVTLDNANAKVNNGKVVLKLNGRTIRDSNGNVIYGYVQNGKVKITVKIPDNMNAKVYNLTAVYAGNNYNRCEASTNITVIAKA